MALTKRQKAYRKYLNGEHWKGLRASAIKRDGGKCVRCESETLLQVHHLKYRGKLEDCTIDDLETLCRKCHRLEHGIGPSDFDVEVRRFKGMFLHLEKPTVEDWNRLTAAIEIPLDLADFGDVMFLYVFMVVPEEKNKGVRNWHLDNYRRSFWRDRAHAVRRSIQQRALQWSDAIEVQRHAEQKSKSGED